MTSELRPAEEVATEICGCAYANQRKRDIAVIEADREAVRAEQAAELAKFKALAEELAGALGPFAEEWNEREFLAECHWSVYWEASKALRQYKEARDA